MDESRSIPHRIDLFQLAEINQSSSIERKTRTRYNFRYTRRIETLT
jgi:hypothetical protein